MGGNANIDLLFKSESTNQYIAAYISIKICGAKLGTVWGVENIPKYHDFDIIQTNITQNGYRILLQTNRGFESNELYKEIMGFTFKTEDESFSLEKNMQILVQFTDKFPDKPQEQPINDCGDGICSEQEMSAKSCPFDCDNICPNGFINCGIGKFKSGNGCENCDQGCKQCQFKVQCSSCYENFYRLYSKCVQKCPTSYYQNAELSVCSKCDNACKTCFDQGPFGCTECNNNFYKYKLNNQNICIPQCDYSCQTCLKQDRKKCLTCRFGMYLLNKQCLYNCPEYYYQNQKKCSPCIENCLKCDNDINCIQCQQAFIYKNNKDKATCTSTCDKAQYVDKTLGICTKCIQNCFKCLNGTTCYECQQQFLLINNQCLQDCQKGEYRDFDLQCKKCMENCDTCKVKDKSIICKQCTKGFVIFKEMNHCEQECPSGYFSDLIKCKKCSDNCRQCELSKCQICAELYFLQGNKCVQKCDKDFYQNQTKQECIQCSQNCNKCRSDIDCSKCELPYLLQNKICVKTCSNGYQLEKDGETQQCHKCETENCTKCSQDRKQCLTCKDGLILFENYCINPCQKDEFRQSKDFKYKCAQCEQSCQTCIGFGLDHCTSCPKNKFLDAKLCSFADLEKCFGKCISNCNLKQFQYKDNCINCHVNCLTCFGQTENNCLSCSQPYFYDEQNKKCEIACQNKGYFTDKEKFVCKKCQILGCDDCQQDVKQCKKCDEEFISIIKNDVLACTKSCQGDYFYDKTSKICKQCYQDCLACKDELQNNCTLCKQDFYLLKLKELEGHCVLNCSLNGYYPQLLTKTCEKCDIHCETCLNNTPNCTKCAIGFYKYFNNCIQNCPINYYPDDSFRICSQCDKNCQECDHLGCKNCTFGYFLMNNKCESKCQSSYFVENNKCSLCHITCTECFGKTQKECSSCANEYYLLNSSCQLDCPSGYFKAENKCKQCYFFCTYCQNQHDECLACIQNYYLLNNKCVLTCGSGFFGQHGLCQKCPKECSECQSSNVCLQCQTGLVLYNDKCLVQCQENQYIYNKQCIDCNSNCKKCKGYRIDECNGCYSDKYLYQNKCITKCPTNYFENKDIQLCQQCHRSCLQCKNEFENGCTICQESLKLNENGYCVTDCKLNEFYDRYKCKKCHRSCQKCFGPNDNQCTECKETYCQQDQHRCVQKCDNLNVCVEGKCTDRCHDGLFLDPQRNNCTKQCQNLQNNITMTCVEKCEGLTQQVKNSNICTNCYNSNYLVENGYCVKVCSSGFFQTDVNYQKICIKCHESCKDTCYGIKSSNCLSCQNESQFKPLCVQNCLSNDSQLKQCQTPNFEVLEIQVQSNQKYSVQQIEIPTQMFIEVSTNLETKESTNFYRYDLKVEWENQNCGDYQNVLVNKDGFSDKRKVHIMHSQGCKLYLRFRNCSNMRLTFLGYKSQNQKIIENLPSLLKNRLNNDLKIQIESIQKKYFEVKPVISRMLQTIKEYTLVEMVLIGDDTEQAYNSQDQEESLTAQTQQVMNFLTTYERLNLEQFQYQLVIASKQNILKGEVIEKMYNISGIFKPNQLDLDQQEQTLEQKLMSYFIFGFIFIFVLIILLLFCVCYLIKYQKRNTQLIQMYHESRMKISGAQSNVVVKNSDKSNVKNAKKNKYKSAITQIEQHESQIE